MSVSVGLLLLQLIVPPQRVRPLLAFPEPGLDDTLAYHQYETRLYRDAARNTLQIYKEGAAGRVVHVWADADDESIGVTARDARGTPATLAWTAELATVTARGRTRTVEYGLTAAAGELRLGHFLLGSMRVERDFQYAGRQRAPFGGATYPIAEVERLLAAIDQLPAADQQRALATLHAPDLATLRARTAPSVTVRGQGTGAVVRVVQPSLDARDTLMLELRPTSRDVSLSAAGDSVVLRHRTGGPLAVRVRISTTGRALTPLARSEIFRPAFLAFLDSTRRATAGASPTSPAALHARRLERQVRGVELLVSREKLMAGLPTYATYFGRDMLVSALMMGDIWRPAMSEAAIRSALRKLGPQGDVSHEEAVGGQAVREHAAEYATLADSARAHRTRGDRAGGDALLRQAGEVLSALRTPRENYHMIDDEFQLPVLVARWLRDPAVTAAQKRAFLLDSSDGGGSRLARLVRELALVARLTAPYAARADATNLISFPPRDGGWSSASWRDSGAGYAGGRFAMDVNAIWVPHALEATGEIIEALGALGLISDSVLQGAGVSGAEPLGGWVRAPEALRAAIATWNGAARHFAVTLVPDAVRARIAARLAAMPAEERLFWAGRLRVNGADRDTLSFLALSLDERGRPVEVANSDVATRLFLGARERQSSPGDRADMSRVLRDVRLFVRPYPAGLLVEGVGPAVSNDAFATPDVWHLFEKDPYHGPRVVWGREVNLFLLGVAHEMARASSRGSPVDIANRASYVRELRDAAQHVRDAVTASGFHGELWSYGFTGGRLVPMRYGTAGDVQLWSTTELAVEYALSRTSSP